MKIKNAERKYGIKVVRSLLINGLLSEECFSISDDCSLCVNEYELRKAIILLKDQELKLTQWA